MVICWVVTPSCQSDIGPYREEIKALARVVGQADEDSFAAACTFLVRVRERARLGGQANA